MQSVKQQLWQQVPTLSVESHNVANHQCELNATSHNYVPTSRQAYLLLQRLNEEGHVPKRVDTKRPSTQSNRETLTGSGTMCIQHKKNKYIFHQPCIRTKTFGGRNGGLLSCMHISGIHKSLGKLLVAHSASITGPHKGMIICTHSREIKEMRKESTIHCTHTAFRQKLQRYVFAIRWWQQSVHLVAKAHLLQLGTAGSASNRACFSWHNSDGMNGREWLCACMYS